MRIIQSDCEVIYDGRGHTELARGIRLILIKDDGTVIIHRTTGVKPTNYMGSVVSFDEYDDGERHVILAKSKKEQLMIINYNMVVDVRMPKIPDDADFNNVGTERQQQEWLSRHFHEVFGESNVYIMREFQTGDGSCDLLGYDTVYKRAILIEVKRKAVKKDVYQVLRYRDAVMKAAAERKHDILDQIPSGDYSLSMFDKPHLILAAESVSRGVENECEQHGVKFVCTGTEWRHDTVPNSVARKDVNNTSTITDANDLEPVSSSLFDDNE